MGVYRALVGKHEGKRPLGRPWRRREDNTRAYCKVLSPTRKETSYSEQTRDLFNILPTKRELFQRIFALGIFGGGAG
jgi:hypothetical protein